ncbi:hypothetical protein CR105_00645 [Massilia eurypsychrophila]|jgi:hypothetical protein|uniref:DUF304 domain-containing protein n=1 Tax=Massilia eurypsychrophila TaxID=1485217 RepID=A0A2G8TKY0_9BURK|nr:hypothetical protein [Massilia eurypsychrophila]PIL46701.1 hypothetical protein CR105_00645 [Massilia eurypsychrophila]
MEEDNSANASANAHVVGVKSWIAYFGTLVLAAILFFGLLPLAFMWNEIAAGVVFVVSAIMIGYRLLLLRSVQLYYDDVGVWTYSGILPWKKGLSGVKWRDMDEATFVPGFWSWLTGSYTVRIGHRFTKANEIVLTNIARGKAAVNTLNAYQQDLIRTNVID